MMETTLTREEKRYLEVLFFVRIAYRSGHLRSALEFQLGGSQKLGHPGQWTCSRKHTSGRSFPPMLIREHTDMQPPCSGKDTQDLPLSLIHQWHPFREAGKLPVVVPGWNKYLHILLDQVEHPLGLSVIR